MAVTVSLAPTNMAPPWPRARSKVSAVIATAVNAEGEHEIIGFEIATTDDAAGVGGLSAWTGGPGPQCTRLVISDALGGIKADIALVFSEASWQRCRSYFMANLASRVAKGNWPMTATLGALDLRAARP